MYRMYRWLTIAVFFVLGVVTISQVWHNHSNVKLLQRVVLEQQETLVKATKLIKEQQVDQDKLWNILLKKKVLTWDDVNPILPGGGREFPSPEERVE